MKEYISLYKTHNDNYLPITKGYQNSLTSLFSLLFGDFRPRDTDFLNLKINLYNANFIYHNFENEMLYIGFGDWLIDEEIDGPSEEEFPQYLNETNSCKMSVDNFMEFRQTWIAIKKTLPDFVLLYRDELEWVHGKEFATQPDIELFVKNYTAQVIH